MSPSLIRILIADDHSVVRRGVLQILGLAPELKVVAEAVDGNEVLARLAEQPVDVLVTDISMPGTSAIELITRLRAEYPRLAILVHSMHNEGAVAARLLRAGATGYVTKDGDPATLLAAVRSVAAGERYLDARLAAKLMMSQEASRERPLHELLSKREQEVLDMVLAGQSLCRIAEALALSPKTVSSHKARIMRKLRLQSNADLVRYAVQNQLIK